jgi:hypothetical protein
MVVMVTPRLISPQDAFHQKVLGDAMGKLEKARSRIHGEKEEPTPVKESTDD